jgi:hypothetical protein
VTLRSRLGWLEKAMDADQDPGPLTIVLTEAQPGQPVERRERNNSAGLPVLEIVYDTTLGPGSLPRSPYKLVHGVDPIDLV